MKAVPSDALARSGLIARLRARLLRTSRPKSLMAGLVLGAGLLGLLTSRTLISLHLFNMAWRYPIAVVSSYAGFVGMVGVWILSRQGVWRTGAANCRELPIVRLSRDGERPTNDCFSWLDFLDFVEVDLGILPLICCVVSIVLMIWNLVSLVAFAPEFFAEVLLDGAFAVAVCRRLGAIEHQHWLRTVFAKTKTAFFCSLLFFWVLGILSSHYAPGAVSIGGVARQLLTK